MLVRLLVAVLMLMGPNPVRFCTCTASASPLIPTHESLAPEVTPAPSKSGCGCRSKSPPNSSRGENGEGKHDRTNTQENHPDSDRHPHDPSCPAVTAQPVVAAIPTPAPDAPADCDCAFLTWAEPANDRPVGLADPADSHLRTRSVPLYISFLTLRN